MENSSSNDELNISVCTGTTTDSIRHSLCDTSVDISNDNTGNTTLFFRREFESKSTIFDDQAATISDENNAVNCEDNFQSSIENLFPSAHCTENVEMSRTNDSSNGNCIDATFRSNRQELAQERHFVDSLYDDYHEEYEHDDSEYDNDDSDYEEDINEGEPQRCNEGLQSLFQMLQSDKSNEIINTNFVVSEVEILLAVFTFAKKYSLPNCATSDLCKMINAFVGNPIIPDTRYLLDKLFYNKEGIEYHAVCPTCRTYIDKFHQKDRTLHCNICDIDINLKSASYRDFFVVLNVENQIRHLIENNSEYFTSVTSERENGHFKDIYDGRCYKKVLRSIPHDQKHSSATITFNSDGSPIFKSSKFSVWPIHINVNEIPPHARNNPITCSIWFGREKPNMTTFLRPFVGSIKQLSVCGINCRINAEIRNIKVYAVCCCADSVARAPMQGIIQYNGKYGCNWCLHPGESVVHNTGRAIKYPLLDNVPQKRTEADHMNMVREALDTARPAFGVTKASPLLTLANFDIIDGFVPDAMHCVALGVVKQFFHYWFHSSGQSYTLSKDQISLIDKTIISFKVPNIVARLSRSIYDFTYWKSRELENWLLYYSLPILQNIRGFEKFAEHWEFLVQAFYILMKNNITAPELRAADNFLKRFIALTEYYYSKDAMTYNVHQLTHLTQSVANWGPLWAHIGYPFESANGQLVRTVHAAKGVINQMCRNISVQESIIIMENHLEDKEFSPVSQYCYYLNNRCTQGTDKLNKCRYFGRLLRPNEMFVQQLGLSEQCRAYHRLVKEKCLFKSCKKVCARSNNSFALTVHNEFIQLEEFLVDRTNQKEFTICRKVVVENACRNACTSIKKIVRFENNLKAIETKNIQSICVVMLVNRKHYISAVPNTYWYS